MARRMAQLPVSSGRKLAFTSAILTLVTTGCLVGTIVLIRARANHNFDCFGKRAVDVSCVHDAVRASRAAQPMQLAENIIGALSSFTLLPVIYLLHDVYHSTGHRSHVMLPAFALAAGLRLLELTFRAGVTVQSRYLVDSWDLSDEDLRSLLIAFETTESQGTWLWSLDYLFLGIGLGAAGFAGYDYGKFPRFWCHLGVFAGVVSCVIFILSFVRLTRYTFLLTTAGIMMGVDGFILLPVWIAVLGCYLQSVFYDMDL